MNKKRIGIYALSATIVLSAAGCGSQTVSQKQESNMPKGEVSYPIDTEETLTYWARLTPALGTSVTNFAETPFAQEYMEKTGIKVTYEHPANGQEEEVLNLLIASGDLPDIIETAWLQRSPESSIAQNVILSLNSYIDDYSPNLKKYITEHPDIDKALKTDEGNYYVYPFIRGDEKLLATSGFMFRSDWLEEFGMQPPETIDEWSAALAAFKQKCETPLAIGLDGLYRLAGAYDTYYTFYINDDGKVTYGPIEPGFREFLQQMKDWYAKGYINKNFAILDTKLITSDMLSGNAGVAFGAGGSAMGSYLGAMEGKDDTYGLVAVPYPTLEKGTRSKFGNKEPMYSAAGGAAITAKSKNPALAARFLDYSYSEEGYMLNNFGIEGESYQMVDGYPTYTDTVMNNPDGLSLAESLALYVRSSNEGPFVQDKRYIEQYYKYDSQKEALDVWGRNDHEKYVLPQVTMTQEESAEYSKIITEVETYMEEMVTAFIMGTTSLDQFDQYVSEIKGMNIDRAVELQQNALDRFRAR